MTITLLVATASANSGCSTVWSESQRKALAAVALEAPTVAERAYHKPDATRSPGMADTIPAYTGGGLIPALVGIAIDASVTGEQQRKFEKSSKQHFEDIERLASDPPVDQVADALRQCLEADEFFGPRLNPSATNRFAARITGFGFVRSGAATDQDMRLCFQLSVRVGLKGRNESVFLDQTIVGRSKSSARVVELLAKPELIAKLRGWAIRDFVANLKTTIDQKLGMAPKQSLSRF